MTLTHDQMLELWRLHLHLEPKIIDASVERFDYLDIDRDISLAMRAWYLDLLRYGDLDLLQPEDIVSRVTFRDIDGRHVQARLPSNVVRVTGLTLEGDTRPLPVATVTPDQASASAVMRRCDHSLLSRRASLSLPTVSVIERDIIIDYGDSLPFPPSHIMAVTDPGDEIYVLHERALSLIRAKCK